MVPIHALQWYRFADTVTLAFREKAEETLKKRGSIDFSKQRAEMKAILAKAKF